MRSFLIAVPIPLLFWVGLVLCVPACKKNPVDTQIKSPPPLLTTATAKGHAPKPDELNGYMVFHSRNSANPTWIVNQTALATFGEPVMNLRDEYDRTLQQLISERITANVFVDTVELNDSPLLFQNLGNQRLFYYGWVNNIGVDSCEWSFKGNGSFTGKVYAFQDPFPKPLLKFNKIYYDTAAGNSVAIKLDTILENFAEGKIILINEGYRDSFVMFEANTKPGSGPVIIPNFLLDVFPLEGSAIAVVFQGSNTYWKYENGKTYEFEFIRDYYVYVDCRR